MNKYSDIIHRIDEIVDFLKTHNKNYTKEQYFLILELQDLVHEMRQF